MYAHRINKVMTSTFLPGQTLYKRRSNNDKIQTWMLDLAGSPNDEVVYYHSVSGVLGSSKLVTSKSRVVRGKNKGRANETTAYEQALREINAKYKRRIEVDGFVVVIDNADEGKQYFQPMLAEKYSDKKHSDHVTAVFNGEAKHNYVYAQRKLDGLRVVVTKDGVFSRRGKPFPVLNDLSIHPSLLPFLNMGYVFDGEIYSHEHKENFNKILSVAKKQKATPENIKEAKEQLQYWIYDRVYLKNLDIKQSYTERFVEWSRAFGSGLNDMPSVAFEPSQLPTPNFKLVVVDTVKCRTQSELDKHYEQALNEGYEGQMIRFDEPYEMKRSKNLLKRKSFITEEFAVTDVLEGEGNRSNMAGKIEMITKDGKTFTSNIYGDFAYYKHLLEEKHRYIGGEATVKFLRWTPDGVPYVPCVQAFYPGKRDI